MSDETPRFTSDRRGGQGSSQRRPAADVGTPIEAELAAIFGEDELLRHPPDPFEEKILTGRNSFTDLRDQLAAEAATPPTPPAPPLRRPSTTPRPRPSETVPATVPTPSTTSAQNRIAELRQDLANRSAARTQAAQPAPSSRFFSSETPGDPAGARPTTTPRPTTPRPPLPRPTTTTTPPRPAAPAQPVDDRVTALRRDLASRRAAASATPPVVPVAPVEDLLPEIGTPQPTLPLTPPRVARPTPHPVEVAPTPTPVRERRPVSPVAPVSPTPSPRPAPVTPRPRPVPAPVPVAPEPEPEPVVVPEPQPEPVAPVDLATPEFVAPEPEPAPQPAPAAPPKAPARKPAAPRTVPLDTAEIVSATGLTKVYGTGATQVHALRGVDLGIGASQLTAIMGRSGSGKSTLLHCLAGLDTVTAGTVQVKGQTVSQLKERQLAKFRRDTIGFVFQTHNLLPTLTIAENIRLPLAIKKDRADQAWFDQVVSTLRLSDVLGRRPAQVSGGQQQRAAVARALITRPAVVFADEPTGSLDSETAEEVLALLRACVDDLRQTIVMATHDPIAAAHADRVVILADGVVTATMNAPGVDRVIDALRS